MTTYTNTNANDNTPQDDALAFATYRATNANRKVDQLRREFDDSWKRLCACVVDRDTIDQNFHRRLRDLEIANDKMVPAVGLLILEVEDCKRTIKRLENQIKNNDIRYADIFLSLSKRNYRNKIRLDKIAEAEMLNVINRTAASYD